MSYLKQPWVVKTTELPSILVGIGGGGGLPVVGVDAEAREKAQEAIDAVATLTAQVGDVVEDQQGVLSTDGILYVNNSGSPITLSGSDNLSLAADGLEANGGVIVDGSVTNQKLQVMQPNTIKGNLGAAAAQPQDLDPIGIAAVLPSASQADKGVMAPNDKRKLDNTEYVFPNVAAMLASSDLNLGDVVKTLGYTDYADGGSNRYLVVDAGTGIPDGGAFIDLPVVGLQARALFIEGDVRIEQWGIVKGGATDCAPAFQAAIDWCNANGVAKLIGAPTEFEDYALASQITLREDVYVDLRGQTIFPLSDDAGFLLAKKSGIQDFIFEASGRETWDGPLFLLNDYTDSNIVNFPTLSFIRLNCKKAFSGETPHGRMFEFNARAGTRISGVRATQLNAQSVGTIAEFFPSIGTDSGWINSNHLQFDMIYNPKTCFTIDRADDDGPFTNNYISATIQPGPLEADYVVRCEGASNVFDLTVWDWFTDEMPICLDFGPLSSRNMVTGAFPPLGIRDKSVPNQRNTFISRINRATTTITSALEPTSRGSGLFGGQQDNCLAYGDVRYNVTAPSPNTGNVKNLFIPNGNGRALWNSVTELEIEIDVLETKAPLRTAGMVFEAGHIPDRVTIEVSLNGTDWTETATMVGSRLSGIFDSGTIGGQFRYLRYRITCDTAKDVSLNSVFAWWTGEQSGAFLPVAGGEVFGDLKLKDGKGFVLESSSGTGSAVVEVDNSSRLDIEASGGVKLNGTRILGDQQAAVSDPSGGGTVDTEARAALVDLLDRLRSHGLIAI